MTVRAVIFDFDGTLVDTNDAHVEAWLAAFRDFDGTSLSILGEDCDQREGEALETHERHFMTMAKGTIFRVFPGTEDLLGELRRRTIATAVATSSRRATWEARRSASLKVGNEIGRIGVQTQCSRSR